MSGLAEPTHQWAKEIPACHRLFQISYTVQIELAQNVSRLYIPKNQAMAGRRGPDVSEANEAGFQI